MPSLNRSSPKLPLPRLFEASSQALCLESILADLPLHEFQVESYHTGMDIAQIFEQHSSLPGVVLLEHGRFLGMISRQRLLEFLIRPRGSALFLPSALSVLYSYARADHLVMATSTSILTAAQLALRRLPEQQSEPIVVQITPQTYRLLDIHDLNIAYWQLRGVETQVRYERAQTQMIQSEKMASLGRLVDGVAHEILDPVGFIWGNLTHLSTYTAEVMQLLAAYEQHFPEAPPEIRSLQADIELDYLRDDLPQTIASIRAGAERLKNLVTSLQNFCHIDDVYPKPADIHECLDSILLLLKSRLSGEIRIVRNYGHLPPVSCFAGQLNQVFMNILTNAVNALLNQAVRQELSSELRSRKAQPIGKEDEPEPQITITTQVRSAPAGNSDSIATRWVTIQIIDNGPGLSAEKYQQVLDSFSVEKRADKETSLAMSYQIITAKHGGKLYFHSPPDKSTSLDNHGAAFEIWLPLV
jgi:signal transduction histidine kinase